VFVAHDAFRVQGSLPVFMVTTPPLIEQAAAVVVVMVGVTPEFSVVTNPVNVDRYWALLGAPVKVTVGATLTTTATALTVSFTVGAAA
jgi:hypothetical protein